MPNELWVAIIGVAGTLAGVWIGARLSNNTAQNLMAQQAKAEFSAKFTETLIQLHAPVDEPGIGEALEILKKTFPSHLTAYLKLKAIIPSKHCNGIEEAWNRYTKDGNYELQKEKEMYRFTHVLSGKNDREMRLLAIKHVNALINSVKKT